MVEDKVLIVGSGGREHALGWKLAQSEKVSQLYFAPGNGGTAKLGKNLPIKTDEIKKLVKWAKKEKIDLVVVGPEIPLEKGLVDEAEESGLLVFGPSKKAARLETSKNWAMEFMERHNIPHPEFRCFEEAEEAIDFVEDELWPEIVIKADGLAAGKGVLLPEDKQETIEAIRELMVDKKLGSAGNQILVQERIAGPEFSIFALCDGENYVMLPALQDHKRIFDNDEGPNTGGMGAYTPVKFVDKELMKQVEKTVIASTIKGMKEEGYPYKGVLYAGMMLTDDGPKVIEFNARFGDPECQPLMMVIGEDLYPVLKACAKVKLKERDLVIREGAAICVISAAEGYPGKYKKGDVIMGWDNIYDSDVEVFHAGTKAKGKEIVTSGGRVLGVTGFGNNFEEARWKVYQEIGKAGVYFEGMQFRSDIGDQALYHQQNDNSLPLWANIFRFLGYPFYLVLLWILNMVMGTENEIDS